MIGGRLNDAITYITLPHVILRTKLAFGFFLMPNVLIQPLAQKEPE